MSPIVKAIGWPLGMDESNTSFEFLFRKILWVRASSGISTSGSGRGFNSSTGTCTLLCLNLSLSFSLGLSLSLGEDSWVNTGGGSSILWRCLGWSSALFSRELSGNISTNSLISFHVHSCKVDSLGCTEESHNCERNEFHFLYFYYFPM